MKHFHTTIPILGVCLGHQVIGEALGGKVVPAKQIMHGKTSLVAHQNTGAFKELQNPIEVMRYHSYVVDRDTLPEELEVVAYAIEDGEIMYQAPRLSTVRTSVPPRINWHIIRQNNDSKLYGRN